MLLNQTPFLYIYIYMIIFVGNGRSMSILIYSTLEYNTSDTYIYKLEDLIDNTQYIYIYILKGNE